MSPRTINELSAVCTELRANRLLANGQDIHPDATYSVCAVVTRSAQGTSQLGPEDDL